ncbi:sensor histidine kinase [Oscillatoria salina]|uniref:sensor histidine kinase n=1 Tax=Oscillatoria salina TaxID=331517 RepID=UPI001CCC4E9A|nr:sensor histidine kinase [Oscillatoria salina]MBZ8182152.1 sensor histidine kinase [Oscillatoria salina IIICB1]
MIRLRNHPFPFLLYLEWALLFVALLTELLPSPRRAFLELSPVSILSIAAFLILGLRLPTKPVAKVFYTALEFGLIIIATSLDYRSIRLLPFLYLVLVIRSSLLFPLSGRLLVATVAFTSFFFRLFYLVNNVFPKQFFLVQLLIDGGCPLAQELVEERFNSSLINLTFLFALVLIFVLLLVNALLKERQSQEKLTVALAQLRDYALRIEDLATLEERNRIAREIHDSLGHFLTGLNIQLETALKLQKTKPEQAQIFLQEAKNMGSNALQAVRQSVATLRSDPWLELSLADAIASLTDHFTRTTNIIPDCEIFVSQSLPIDVKTAIYRIIQEGLTNICKYAQATSVKIKLQATQSSLSLTLEDNGRGFRPEENLTGFGLQGMRERAMAFGGNLYIESQPGAGCKITVKIPLTKMPK